MEKESKIIALRYSMTTYRGGVFETNIILDFENMTGIKKSGNGFLNFKSRKPVKNDECENKAFKLKNSEKLQNLLKSVEEICENWKEKYVAPATFRDKSGNVYPASDGYNYEVDIEYKNGIHKQILGSRSKPENFDEFVDVIYKIVDED